MSRAPDFGFKTSEGIVLIDATVFHGGILDTWTRTVKKIDASISDHLLKHDHMLSISIALPLQIEMTAKEIVNLALNAFSDSPEGKIPIGSKGLLEWEQFPIMVLENGSPLPREIPFNAGAFVRPGVIIDKAYACQKNIKFSSEEDILQAKKLLLKGLRSKLDEKKTQFPQKGEPEPCFIVMRLEHNQIGEGDIKAMLNERFWPNWLTGLALFTPRQGYIPGNHQARLIWHFNPQSFRPATASLIDILCKPS